MLITADKDFGELILLQARPQHGVVLPRFTNPSPAHFIRALDEFFYQTNIALEDRFIVLSDAGIRIH